MGETTAYLSPNGDNLSRGDGPATRLVVATVEGVATFRRGGRGAPWHLTDRSLSGCHVGSLLFEPVSGKLFAGAHADGGLWVNDDEVGSWRRLTDGLDRPHIYSLAARRIGDRVTLFAGTEPAALYRSEDFGESWKEAESLREVPGTDKWIFPPPPHLAHVKSVVFHPTRERTFYALVEQGALLQTDDDGQTWTELAGYAGADDIAYHDVHRLVISTNDPRLFYLATGEGLYCSGDGGQSWEHLMPRAGRIGYPDFLFFDPTRRRHAVPGRGAQRSGQVVQRPDGRFDRRAQHRRRPHLARARSRHAEPDGTGIRGALPAPLGRRHDACRRHRNGGDLRQRRRRRVVDLLGGQRKTGLQGPPPPRLVPEGRARGRNGASSRLSCAAGRTGCEAVNGAGGSSVGVETLTSIGPPDFWIVSRAVV